VGVFVLILVAVSVGVLVFVIVFVMGVGGFMLMCVRLGSVMGLFGDDFAFVDVDFGGGDSAAVDFFDLQGSVEIQGRCGFVEYPGIDSGVNEGSEKHVA